VVTHHQFTVRLRVQYDGSPPACQLIRQQHLEAPLLQVLHLHTHHPHLVWQAHGHGAGWGLPRWLQSNKESCISHFIDLHIKMAVAKHRHTISFPMQNSLFCIKYNVITLAYQRISMQSCVAPAPLHKVNLTAQQLVSMEKPPGAVGYEPNVQEAESW